MLKRDEEYTLEEIMAVCGSRELKDGERVIVGTGLPILSSSLAKRLHAPKVILVFESGIVDARPERLPISVAGPSLVPGCVKASGLVDIMGTYVQRGLIDVGFLGAAQIDKYGNINSTCIGNYETPKVRLPGSGGANAIGSLAKRTIIIMAHGKNRFVKKVDYLTTPGYLTGPGAREKAGLPPGTGPSAVISTLGIFRFESKTKEMYLDLYYPGVTIEQIRQNTEWDLKVSPEVKEVTPPTFKELEILREIDPQGIFLGKR